MSEAANDTRGCTCHPDDAPTPCQHKYATGDCIASAACAAGIAEGRRQGLEEAARAAGRAMIPEDCSPAEAHGRLMQAVASRDAVLALAKETNGE